MFACAVHTGPDCRFCDGSGQHQPLPLSRAYPTPAKQETPAMSPSNNDDHDLLAWAAKQTWSSFAMDVARKAETHGLSPNQRAALLRMRAKDQTARATTHETPAHDGIEGFAEVIRILDHIDASGNKWPSFKLTSEAGTVLKVYRMQKGQNAGSAGFKLAESGTNLGLISREGAWQPSALARAMDRQTKADIWPVIDALRNDALGALAANGKRLGICACCGRPLSNDESVARGIGPECWAKISGVI
jgi:hypothetical protein